MASALGVTAVGMMTIGTAPVTADVMEVEYVYDYTCEGKLAPGTAGVDPTIEVQLTIPKTVYHGRSIQFGWNLVDSPTKPSFLNPGDFPAGGRVSAVGTVSVSGALNGTIQSLGAKDLGAIVAGKQFLLPEKLIGGSGIVEGSEIKVTPGPLKIDFTPAQTAPEINDASNHLANATAEPEHTQGPVKYSAGWTYSRDLTTTPPAEEWETGSLRDRNADVHWASGSGVWAEMEFFGTGVEFVAERYKQHGDMKVELHAEGKPMVSATAYPSKLPEAEGGAVAEKRRGQQVLWKSGDLPYGKHKIKVTSQVGTGQYAVIDGFNVISGDSSKSTPYFETICKPPTNAKVATVKVEKAPTPTPTATTPTPTPTRTPTVVPSTYYTTVPPHTATPKPTLTVTATVTPTRPTPTAPQVIVTPSGGAQTGEAPDENRSGAGLIGGGTAMVLASVVGGVALRRRRAAHSQGR
ncbi:hypothetical protein [Streptosporangium sp. NPDC049376]|uniref:hypothetical protein n=1 Tax=Streptosporangium sp. NPDC049376 TaxID=3366192 RepID=UPI003797DFD3